MPTKPATFFTHATDTVFSSGPANGLATKIPVPDNARGFDPGSGIAAEHMNHRLHEIGSVMNEWVMGGTAVADASQHIVETTLTGLAAIRQIVTGTPTLDGESLTARNASLSPCVDAINTGSGSGLQAAGRTGARCLGQDQPGVLATSATGHAIQGIGGQTGAGALCISGTSGAAVIAVGNRASPSPCIDVYRQGVGGYQRGAIALAPQADPSEQVHGDLWASGVLASTENLSALAMQERNPLKVWGTQVGYFCDHAANLSDTVASVVAVPLEALSLTIDPLPGRYLIHFSCAARLITTGTQNAIVTLSAGGRSVEYTHKPDLVGARVPIAATWLITTTGVTTLTITVATSATTAGVAVDQAEITVTGAYDLRR